MELQLRMPAVRIQFVFLQQTASLERYAADPCNNFRGKFIKVSYSEFVGRCVGSTVVRRRVSPVQSRCPSSSLPLRALPASLSFSSWSASSAPFAVGACAAADAVGRLPAARRSDFRSTRTATSSVWRCPLRRDWTWSTAAGVDSRSIDEAASR